MNKNPPPLSGLFNERERRRTSSSCPSTTITWWMTEFRRSLVPREECDYRQRVLSHQLASSGSILICSPVKDIVMRSLFLIRSCSSSPLLFAIGLSQSCSSRLASFTLPPSSTFSEFNKHVSRIRHFVKLRYGQRHPWIVSSPNKSGQSVNRGDSSAIIVKCPLDGLLLDKFCVGHLIALCIKWLLPRTLSPSIKE